MAVKPRSETPYSRKSYETHEKRWFAGMTQQQMESDPRWSSLADTTKRKYTQIRENLYEPEELWVINFSYRWGVKAENYKDDGAIYGTKAEIDNLYDEWTNSVYRNFGYDYVWDVRRYGGLETGERI